MENLTSFFENVLAYSDRAMTYAVNARLANMFPGQSVQTTSYLPVDTFVRYGQAEARASDRLDEMVYRTYADDAKTVSLVSWIEVFWRGNAYQVLRAPLNDRGENYWVVGPPSSVAEFIQTVRIFSRGNGPETKIYKGWWDTSPSIDRAIEKAAWEDVVLPASMVDLIELNAIRFFDQREHFERLGVPWKRGLLMTGPPGNGKTHLIRAILNRLPVPRLIVKSFGEDQDDIEDVFDQVRVLAPCVLVLEDIDSLIPPMLLSAVLNSLDGTEPLDGVLMLATTNHPEKLDPAIRNRPSRFDRVIEFGPPALPERVRLLGKFLSRLPDEAKLLPFELEEVAVLAEGFSYAYMKELAVSAASVWVNDRRPMREIATELIGELKLQIAAAATSDDDSPSD